MPISFGREEEWKYFEESYGNLLTTLTTAHDACRDLLQAAQSKTVSRDDTVILALGMDCLREFEEILLLSGNGYGAGANKLLRTFFERAITLGYLAKHPEEIQQFVDYTNVHWNKLLSEASVKHGDTGLSREEIARIQAGYESVKDKYLTHICKKCGTQRVNGSWTKKSVPEMAGVVDENMRKLYFNAFLRPTFLVHTTFYSVMAAAEKTEQEKLLLFSPTKERARAKETIDLAHLLLIQVATTLNSFYKLDSDLVLGALGMNYGRSTTIGRHS